MSKTPPAKRHKSIRLPGYDYSSASTYFVTQCTTDRQLLFCDVVGDETVLSEMGEIAQEEWERTLEIRPMVLPHAFIVMPNHIHALFSFDENLKPTPVASHSNATRLHRQPRSVGSLMSGYKGAVTRRIRDLIGEPLFKPWQEGFHEHIVRNQDSFERICGYIINNPSKWAEDRENPANWDGA